VETDQRDWLIWGGRAGCSGCRDGTWRDMTCRVGELSCRVWLGALAGRGLQLALDPLERAFVHLCRSWSQ